MYKRQNLGQETVEKWSYGIVNNFARDPKGNDRDQVKAIAAGQGDIAIVNSYYIGLLLSSEKQQEVDAGNSVSVFFPNQGKNERGSHINISGFAMTKNAPNKQNSIKNTLIILTNIFFVKGVKCPVFNFFTYFSHKILIKVYIMQ